MREDDPRLDVIVAKGKLEAADYANKYEEGPQWMTAYNAYFAGYMSRSADDDTREQVAAFPKLPSMPTPPGFPKP